MAKETEINVLINVNTSTFSIHLELQQRTRAPMTWDQSMWYKGPV
jgi:hypothetical protein